MNGEEFTLLHPMATSSLHKRIAVHKKAFSRPQTSILPFTHAHHSIVHRPVAALPPLGGSITIARWQCCHRAVYDGRTIKTGRKSLRSSLMINTIQ